ncbi:MAG: HAD-IA family hydrolase [bacterium]|nr:HAD-IA family hydrolase [bacterium]
MNEHGKSSSPLLRERQMIRQLTSRAIEIGTPIIAESALVQDRDFNLKDVEMTRKLIETVSPVTVENFQLHAHLQLAGKFSKKMAGLMGLDKNEMECLGLLHDFGRFITQRWLREELIENRTLRRMGMRESLLKKTPDVRIFTNRNPGNQNDVEQVMNGLSPAQKVIMMADICGKRKADGSILTFEEVMQHHRSSRSNYRLTTGLAPLWASEKKLNSDVVNFSERIYRASFDWFKSRHVDLEEMRTKILEEESETRVQAVMFDVGNVLVRNPDSEIMQDISRSLDLDTRVVTSAWDELVPKLQIGAMDSEEFWKKFSQMVGKSLPVGYENLLTRHLQTNIDPELEGLIGTLKKSGFKLAVFSDTVKPHIEAYDRTGVYKPFDVRILSPEIGVTKSKPEAFSIAATRLWLPPQGCLFIDDNPEYVQNARNAKMKAVVYESPAQLKRAMKEIMPQE